MSDYALVPVEGVPCPHDGAHPDGHLVSLKPKIGLVGAAVTTQRILAVAPDWALIQGALAECYLRYGMAEIDGVLVTGPDDPEIQSFLDDELAGRPIAEKADPLYSEAVMRPLRAAASKLSAIGSTKRSTSAPTTSSPKRPKRSKRSSTTTSPTDDTETTGPSPDGDSSSSQTPDQAA